MPSANNMSGTPYNELSADLSVQLNPSKGLIQLTTYYGSSATAPGYPEFQQVKEGSSGSPINVSKLEYEEHTVGSGFTSATVYPVKKRISYRSDASGGSDPVETSYTNTFYAGKTQLKQVTEHLPDIDSGQNGGAWLTGNTREQHFDVQGRLEKSVDARSTVTTYAYDDATGTLSQMVQDPTGLNLVTDYQSDGMGRTIQTLGPPHNVNGQTVRTVQWTVYLDDEHEVRTAGGYLIGASSYTLVNPVSITRSDDSGRVTDEIQATRGTGVESSGALTAADSFPQSSWTRWTHHTYGVAGRLESTDVYHDIPASGSGASGTNYDRTEFAYDAMGRQNRVKSPSGTITRMVYDPRGLVLATWVGTNDAGATDGDPSGGGATGNNMRPVTLNTYDTDAYGSGNDSLDGLLTKTASPVDATTANDREVEFTYDWRDRRTTTVTTDGTNTFYAVSTLDNLGRSTAEEQKRGTTLIGKSETFYDDRGQTYQTKRWGVNDSGATTNALTDNTWYDAAGNVLKSLPAGSQAFTKNTYDAIGRQVASYTGYYDGAGDDSPLNLVDNLIFEQAATTYDAASNVTQTASLARYHDGSGTGALVACTNARSAYTALYYDGIGRSVASAEYGNQGSDSVSFSRPASAPSSSDTILVSQTAYNARGEAQDQTDPAGQVTRTTYDDAGRVTSVVQNHGSTPTEQVDTTYAAGGQVQTLTAINSTTGNQVTSYAYGVTLSDSEIASGDLLDSVTYPDSGVVSYMYNRQGQRTQMTDQNGSVHDYVYDPLGRQAADKVTLASGSSVDDGVLRTEWTYDYRQRLKKITSYSAASGGSVVCDVEYAYNSFSQVTTEYQQHGAAVNTLNSPKIVYAYADGSINTVRRTSTTHPDGTVLNYGYGSGSGDKLSRVEKLAWDSTDVVEYAYLGLGQVVIQTYVQPTDDVVYTLDSGTANAYAGLDRFGRIVDLQWEQP